MNLSPAMQQAGRSLAPPLGRYAGETVVTVEW